MIYYFTIFINSEIRAFLHIREQVSYVSILVIYASNFCDLVEGHTSRTVEASVRCRLTLREMVCGRLLSGAISFEIMVLGATEPTPWMTCAGMLMSVRFLNISYIYEGLKYKEKDGKKIKQQQEALVEHFMKIFTLG